MSRYKLEYNDRLGAYRVHNVKNDTFLYFSNMSISTTDKQEALTALREVREDEAREDLPDVWRVIDGMD